MALIYVVEDDANIMEIELFALKNSGFQVKGFENAKDFFSALSEITPSLILLDIMLPDEDGLSIVKKVRQMPATNRIPVIMVTAKTTEIDKVKGFDVGADDYLTKPFGVMELIARVKALIRRTEDITQKKQYVLEDLVLDDEKHIVSVGQEICELTFKEYELLKLMLTNTGVVLTRESIMNHIWGTDYSGETRTVDMHIKTLRQKLGNAGMKIKTIRNVGYLIG